MSIAESLQSPDHDSPLACRSPPGNAAFHSGSSGRLADGKAMHSTRPLARPRCSMASLPDADRAWLSPSCCERTPPLPHRGVHRECSGPNTADAERSRRMGSSPGLHSLGSRYGKRRSQAFLAMVSLPPTGVVSRWAGNAGRGRDGKRRSQASVLMPRYTPVPGSACWEAWEGERDVDRH